MAIKRISIIGEFTKRWNEEAYARGFEELGIVVQRIPEFSFDVSEAITFIENFEPDLILFAKLQVLYRDVFLNIIKKRGIPTASWTFDLYVGLRREILLDTDPIFRADFVFGPDGGHSDLFKN